MLKQDSGAAMVEYIVLAALIALTVGVALAASGTSIRGVFCQLAHRGGDAAGLENCLSGAGAEKDPDSPCINPEECNLITPSPSATSSATANPDCDTGTFSQECPGGLKTIACLRSIDAMGNCAVTCSENCDEDCPACSTAPQPCPEKPSELAPFIPGSCPCEYDYSVCEVDEG